MHQTRRQFLKATGVLAASVMLPTPKILFSTPCSTTGDKYNQPVVLAPEHGVTYQPTTAIHGFFKEVYSESVIELIPQNVSLSTSLDVDSDKGNSYG